MDREVLKGFARIGIFVGGCGLVLAFVEPPNSPEFVVSVCSAVVGGLLLASVVILGRWMR